MAWLSDDWFRGERLDTFRYVEVDKDTMKDLRDLDSIEDGGTIEYKELTALKVSASLPFVGDFDIGNNYLRIYSTSYLGSENVTVLHGTFLPSRPSTNYSASSMTGTLDCYSLLLLAQETQLEQPLSIPAGSLTVLRAEELVRSVGLSVVSDDSTHTLSGPRNYDAGETILEVVNDLLSVAGCDSLNVDASGNARITLYTDPTNRAPSYTLRDDVENVWFSPDVTHEFDTFNVPNKIIAVYAPTSEDETPMTAIAINDDPQSRYSIMARGRVIAHTESVSECESQAELQAVAERKLISESSAVESIDIEHPFLPYGTGEALRNVYTKHDKDFLGVASTKSVLLDDGMPCKAHLRRFVRM